MSLRSQARRVAAYARFEVVGMLRHGEQLLVAIVLPGLALLALGVTDVVAIPGAATSAQRLAVVTPGVLALSIVSSSFTSQAISAAFERRWGVLRQLSTTPLGPGGIVAGKVLAALGVQAIQLAALGSLALVLGWRPIGAAPGVAVLAWLLGSVCFTALGLLLAGLARAEAVLALANLAWVAAAAVGGLVLPPTGETPIPVPATAWLPTGALGDALRAALATPGAPPANTALAVLAGWAALCAPVAARYFRPAE